MQTNDHGDYDHYLVGRLILSMTWRPVSVASSRTPEGDAPGFFYGGEEYRDDV